MEYQAFTDRVCSVRWAGDRLAVRFLGPQLVSEREVGAPLHL